MQPQSVHAIVEDLYLAANEATLSLPPGPGALAVSLIGPDALDYDRRAGAPSSSLIRDHLGWHIRVSPLLSDAETSYAVAHELGRWWCRIDETLWQECEDLLTAGIILPQPALAHAVRHLGMSASEIAEAYVCPLSVVRTQMWRLAKRRQSGTHRRWDNAG